jgi:hypothetical protein
MTKTGGAGDTFAPPYFDVAQLREALHEVRGGDWSLPSTFAQTGTQHGYRRLQLVDHGYFLADAAPFAFVFDEFAPIHISWISWIDPGGFIVPHHDRGPYYERWHVPIYSAGWTEQYDERMEPEDGVPLRVKHWLKHEVSNPSDRPRVHLIIDRAVRVDVPTQPFKIYEVNS